MRRQRERRASKLVEAPRTVVGYHGCSAESAEIILTGGFQASSNRYDWLGVGVYFWEYGPYRAFDWARERFDAPAVLEARIRLGNCLNLLDTRICADLSRAYLRAASEAAADGRELPWNDLSRKLHYRDRFIVEFYCRNAQSGGLDRPQTVRGCFPEGEPIYEGSAILSQSHVQVAVRDLTCIARVRRVFLR